MSSPTLSTKMERARGRRVRMRGGQRGEERGRGRGRVRVRAPEQRRRGPNVNADVRATLIDHVINRGLTMREAGLRVQPNLSRYTVASVIRTFRQQNR